MLTERFLLLNVREVLSKKGNSFYLASLYSTTYNYLIDIFINEEQYSTLLSYSTEHELSSFNLDGLLTKVVIDGKPQIRLSL